MICENYDKEKTEQNEYELKKLVDDAKTEVLILASLFDCLQAVEPKNINYVDNLTNIMRHAYNLAKSINDNLTDADMMLTDNENSHYYNSTATSGQAKCLLNKTSTY